MSSSVSWVCGGAIINATHIMTAAHCLVDAATGRLRDGLAVTIQAGSVSPGKCETIKPQKIEAPYIVYSSRLSIIEILSHL